MGCGNSKAKNVSKPGEATDTNTVMDGPPANPTFFIYGVPVSMNYLGVYMLADQTNRAKVLKLMPTMPGEATKHEDFLKLNPFHAIPTIKDTSTVQSGEQKDEGFCLAESSSILRYIAHSYSEEADVLYPSKDAKRCGFIYWAMDRFSFGMMGDVYKTLYPCLDFLPAPDDREQAGKQASENLQAFADVFLKEKFIGGEKPSIADYKVAPFFYAFEHPVVTSQSQVTIPARIRQFNIDFKLACGEDKIQPKFAELKTMLDSKGSSAAAVGEAAVEKKEWPKDQLTDKKTKAKDKLELEIYGIPASMNSMGPILFAEFNELGKMKPCMPGQKEGGTEDETFKEMNPFHGVPTMKDGEFCLAESNAILRYMAKVYAPKFYSDQNPKVRARIDWAMDRFSSVMGADVVKTLYVCFGYAEPPKEGEAEAAERELQENAKVALTNLDEFAKHFLPDNDTKFITGNELSIADFKVAPFFYAYGHEYVQKRCGIEIPERIAKFNGDFAAAVNVASKMGKFSENPKDGLSIKEVLDQRQEKPADGNTDLQDGMKAQAVDMAPPQVEVTMTTQVEVEEKGQEGCVCSLF